MFHVRRIQVSDSWIALWNAKPCFICSATAKRRACSVLISIAPLFCLRQPQHTARRGGADRWDSQRNTKVEGDDRLTLKQLSSRAGLFLLEKCILCRCTSTTIKSAFAPVPQRRSPWRPNLWSLLAKSVTALTLTRKETSVPYPDDVRACLIVQWISGFPDGPAL